ncbi:hypothetical protein [Psychrobacter piechaudii]|uniref:FlgN protein n=1 Tax=Psychrobacter piechaudii TaxID=1945521 RepID=A0A1R4GXW0_9GAMM|nr:hypothetical protein [Psychrobacter piechaudii]SJM72652.1 hypothetical protein A1232T_01864 [Psychrobacter piechaudii]
MHQFLSNSDAEVHQDYMALRQSLFEMLLSFNAVRSLFQPSKELDPESYAKLLAEKQRALTAFIESSEETHLPHAQVLEKLRKNKIDKMQASSLINDMNYVRRIKTGLSEILISLDNSQFKQ